MRLGRDERGLVTDLDGEPIAGQEIDVTAARLEWKYENGEWNEKEADVQACKVNSAGEPVTCEFDTLVGGRYRITALVQGQRPGTRRGQSRIARRCFVAGIC